MDLTVEITRGTATVRGPRAREATRPIAPRCRHPIEWDAWDIKSEAVPLLRAIARRRRWTIHVLGDPVEVAVGEGSLW